MDIICFLSGQWNSTLPSCQAASKCTHTLRSDLYNCVCVCVCVCSCMCVCFYAYICTLIYYISSFHIFFLFCFSEAECTPLSNNPHVIADPGKDTYIAGDVVSFGCDNGYLLAGNSAISCDENGNIHAHICTHIYHSILYIHYQERMNPAEGGEGACNCYIKRCVNLWRTNCTKCPYMGKH